MYPHVAQLNLKESAYKTIFPFNLSQRSRIAVDATVVVATIVAVTVMVAAVVTAIVRIWSERGGI